MEHPYPGLEFETEADASGKLSIPERLRGQFPAGAKLVVRITPGDIGKLRERGVTEDEIEQISLVQHEQRENVLGFLRAEGSLASDAGFKARASELMSGK